MRSARGYGTLARKPTRYPGATPFAPLRLCVKTLCVFVFFVLFVFKKLVSPHWAEVPFRTVVARLFRTVV